MGPDADLTRKEIAQKYDVTVLHCRRPTALPVRVCLNGAVRTFDPAKSMAGR